MEPPKESVALVQDVFMPGNLPLAPDEMICELSTLGIAIEDADEYVLYEVGVARNIRRACEALNFRVSPYQALTLAKHFMVGKNPRYRNGIPLSEHERTIARALHRINMKAWYKKFGKPHAEMDPKDLDRMISYGENGLTLGHRIGEASGCFKILVLGLSSTFLLTLLVLLIVQ